MGRGIALAGMLAVLGAVSCGNGQSIEEGPTPVMVEVAAAETISRTVFAPCRLEAASEAVVSVSTPSMVEDVLVQPGDTVEAGQRMLLLKTDDMQRAGVLSAAATLAAAEASREYFRSSLQRAEELRAEGAMSESEFQSRAAEASSAEAAYTGALAGYSAALVSMDAGYVEAPFHGVVGRVLATVGNPAAGPLLTVFSADAFRASLLVAPRHLPGLSQGIPAVFTTDHYPGSLFPGAVVAVAPAADPVSGLVAVTAQFTDTTGRLVPGLSGMVMLSLETRTEAPVLGENALTPLGDGIWEATLVENGTAVKVNVITGISNGSRHEITSGIQPGDSVITRGHSLVSHGEPVEAVTE